MARVTSYLLLSVLCSLAVLGSCGTVPPTEIIDVPHAKPVETSVKGATAGTEYSIAPSSAPVSSTEASSVSGASSVSESISTKAVSASSEAPLSTAALSSSESPLSSQQPLSSEASSEPSPSSEAPTTEPSPSPEPSPVPPSPSPVPPAPTPAPGPPEQGKWTYSNDTAKVTCIVVQFAAQLNVTYPVTFNNTNSLDHLLLNVPANATVVDGSCDGSLQWLQISWTVNLTTASLPNNLTLEFYRNGTNYELKSLNVSLSPDLFANYSSNATVELSHGADWQTPLLTSYRCATPTKLNMTAESASVVATMTVSKLQEEAFRSASGQEFSAARDCGGGDVPDAVPIAVGCALGGMVVVVLVAYLVARRRSAARGYLSM